MKVVVTRTGGFAGIVRTAEVDDSAAAAELADSVRQAASRPADDGRRDGFSYEFVVITTKRTTYDVTDAQLDGGLAARLRALF